MSVKIFGLNDGYGLGVSTTEGWINELTVSEALSNGTEYLKIIRGYETSTVALSPEGKLFVLMYGETVLETIEKEEEKFVDISCGFNHFLAVNKEQNKVYSWCYDQTGCQFGQLGHNNTDKVDQPTEITFFTKLGIKIKQICCSAYSSFVLLENNDLYAFGFNLHSDLGFSDKKSKQLLPIKVISNCQKVFNSGFSRHSFYLDTQNKLWGFGFNGNGQFGTGNLKHLTIPTQIGFFDQKEISNVLTNTCSSIVLLKNGNLFSAGFAGTNGFSKASEVFQQIEIPKIKKIYGGYYYTICLSTENELYAFGYSDSYYYKYQQNGVVIKIPFTFKNKNFKIFCGGATVSCFIVEN
ncbi:hypothetical protein M0812_13825 [Anaeramoeba flamelloides]|uniref:Uncharacterized protein n=1 Tax=Anaeramoeba flamelloides TaxID=1746091 RepID=A0AAV7ZIN1_9EUKA|nr:hypothetical protein M0812_13825 [Anaeramoeba flamelloides]